MTVRRLTHDEFADLVGSALESLRMYNPEIEWAVEEHNQIAVWIEGQYEMCHFCGEEVEFRGNDWYTVVDGTTDCGRTGGHVVT